ncbi:hypothetical protein KI387_015816, partial [Taxus chinensis]
MMPPEDPFHQDNNMIGSKLASPVKPRVGGSENVLVHHDPDGDIGYNNIENCHEDHRCHIPAEMEAPVQQPHNLRASNSSSKSILGQPLQPVTLKFDDIFFRLKLKPKPQWYDICTASEYQVVEKTILNGITGIVCPGEILAMLGPSGSGKTTLLSALGGRLNGKISGKILFNGEQLSKSMKRKIGFVSQDDVLYPHLTVKETLTYAALLRLPKTLSKMDKIEQTESVIVELGLTRCRNTIIGGPLIRGVSGGERKRVSIGQEMLINPSLLFLDEPTSGLDSTTAQRIISTLLGLARGGRTVITTIHQPSSRLYHMFHKVILLSEGHPIYHGEASRVMNYFSSIGFSPSFPMNPADFMLDLANGIAPDTRPACNSSIELADSHAHIEPDLQKSVKQSLITAYSKNLAPKLKAEVNIDQNSGSRKHK